MDRGSRRECVASSWNVKFIVYYRLYTFMLSLGNDDNDAFIVSCGADSGCHRCWKAVLQASTGYSG